MIRGLRRWHRGSAMVMAVVLPAVIVIALLEVRPFPRASPLVLETPPPIRPVRYDSLFPGTGILVEIGGDASQPGGVVVGLLPTRPLRAPTVVAYWGRADGADVASEAVLLGSLIPGRWTRAAVPLTSSAGNTLVLFSVALDSVLASAEVPSGAAP